MSETLLNININDICNYGTNIIKESNIYLEMTRELDRTELENWKKTKFYKYYKSYSPKTLFDIYNIDIKVLKNISSGCFFLPWINNYPQKLDRKDSCLFGIKKDDYIYKQIKKTKGLLDSILKNGFKPEEYLDRCDGYIVIQILKYKNNYKYFVISGNHRINVLQSIGYKNIKCKLIENKYLKEKDKINNGIYNKNKPYQTIIDYDNAINWPAVKSEFLTLEEAQKMFLAYFDKKYI
jgi:hypothetical protein